MQFDPGEENKSINLVHDSFKLFVTDRKVCDNVFLVDEHLSNAWIATTCLSYISTEIVPHYDNIYSPEKLRAWLNHEHPLFSYATLYWSSHLPKTMMQNADEYRILIHTLQDFWKTENLCTWIRSVLSYSDQSVYWFSDVHLHSVVSAVSEALTWFQRHHIKLYLDQFSVGDKISEKTGGNFELHSTDRHHASNFIEYFARALALVWLKGDPKYDNESRAVFEMLEILHDYGDDGQPTNIKSTDDRSVLKILRWVDAENMNQDMRWFANVGHAHMTVDRNLQMLQTAIHYYELSIGCDHEDKEISPLLRFLGVVLLMEYYRMGHKGVLHRSIEVSTKAVVLIPDNHPDMPIYVDNLGNGLRCRFERTGSMDDLNESIEAGRKAVELTPDDHSDMAMYANNLGNGLQRRFERTGSMNDLNESIEAGRKAVELTPDDHPNMARYANNLGIGLQCKFERTGSMDDLNESIEAGRKAVELAPYNHPKMAMYINNLKISVEACFARNGSKEDISWWVLVCSNLTSAQPDNPAYNNLLGNSLWMVQRFDEAILSFEKAIQPVSENRPQSTVELLSHNVICDLCSMFPLKGYRYKCKICMDYDVCSGCISSVYKEHNEEHDYLSIPQPSSYL